MTSPSGILRAESGPLAGQSFALDRSPFTIGRSADSDLVVPDTPVSRRHACLELQGDRWFLRDLGSSNGTFLNRQAVRDTLQPLRNGDLVGIGDSVFVFAAQAPQAASPAGDLCQVAQPQGRRAQPATSRQGRSGWILVAAIAIVLVTLVVVAVLLFSGSSGKGDEAGSTPGLPSIGLPTGLPSIGLPTGLPSALPTIELPTGMPSLEVPTGFPTGLPIPTGLPSIPLP